MPNDTRTEVRICKCGHIHLIDESRISNALQQDKELVFICSNCGAAYRIGADREDGAFYGEPGKTFYNMYTLDLPRSKSITAEDFSENDEHKPYSEILYSDGIAVPMMSGMNATHFGPNGFSDNWFPDFLNELNDERKSIEDIRRMYRKWQDDMHTVNIGWFKRSLNASVAEVLAKQHIQGLDLESETEP